MKIIFKLSLILFFTSATYSFVNAEGFTDNFFKELDGNGNGIITEKEIITHSYNEFSLMDKNKDNKISKKEFFYFVCKKNCEEDYCPCSNISKIKDTDIINEMWLEKDVNLSGYVNQREKLEIDLNNFYIMDLNNDGKITIDEVEAQLY